jgi:hypothetical protein
MGGSNTVKVGIARIKFDLCRRKNVAKSSVISMTIIEAKNIVHSIAIFVKLLIPIVVPKYWFVSGHKS